MMASLVMQSVASGIKELEAIVGGVERQLNVHIAAAVNETAKKHVNAIAGPDGPIQKVVGLKRPAIKKSIKIYKANKNYHEATIAFSDRAADLPSLKQFRATQNKQGVKYKIYKTGQGKSLLKGAFKSKKLGNHVFVRSKTQKGSKGRAKIHKRFGPTSRTTYQKFDGFNKFSKREIELELYKQILRRIQFADAKKKHAHLNNRGST